VKREEVLLRLREAWPALSALGVRSLLLFGSVARGEAREESDVDLAVDLEGPITFDRFMALKLYLKEVLGRPVDLVRLQALKPPLRRLVEEEGLRVA